MNVRIELRPLRGVVSYWKPPVGKEALARVCPGYGCKVGATGGESFRVERPPECVQLNGCIEDERKETSKNDEICMDPELGYEHASSLIVAGF